MSRPISIFFAGLLAGIVITGAAAYFAGRAYLDRIIAEDRKAQEERAVALAADVAKIRESRADETRRREAAEQRSKELTMELALVREDRDRALKAIERPVPLPMRARRIEIATRSDAGDVVPEDRNGRKGAWVAEPTLIKLELAATASRALEREARLLGDIVIAERERAQAAIAEARLAEAETDRFRLAYDAEVVAHKAFVESVSDPGLTVTEKLTWMGIGAGAVAVVIGAIAIVNVARAPP